MRHIVLSVKALRPNCSNRRQDMSPGKSITDYQFDVLSYLSSVRTVVSHCEPVPHENQPKRRKLLRGNPTNPPNRKPRGGSERGGSASRVNSSAETARSRHGNAPERHSVRFHEVGFDSLGRYGCGGHGLSAGWRAALGQLANRKRRRRKGSCCGASGFYPKLRRSLSHRFPWRPGCPIAAEPQPN